MRRLSAFLLIIVLVFSLCGCITNKSPYIPTGNGLSDGSTTIPTASQNPDQVISLPYYPDRSLNPYECTDYVNRTILSLVYQGLFSVDAQYNVSPMLCKSFNRSRDMKTYTFTLEDAHFSDGTRLTAADVAASLNAARSAGYFSGRFDQIRSISATADSVVQINLTAPYENLPLLLDVPIVPQSQLKAPRPLGSGPYVFADEGGSFSLRRNGNWWCQASTPITAKQIGLVPAEDPAQLVFAFEQKGSTLGMVVADPGSVNYADFHKDSELWDCETGIFLYLGCHADSKVFSNDDVRQALTYAVDRNLLASQYYRGFATPTVLPVSPKSPVYASGLASRVSYDPARLTEAVKNAGLTGQSVTLLVNSSDGIRLRAARAIAAMLSQCGLKVTTSEQSDSSYRRALANGKFDLYLGQTKLSPNMDLSAFFASKGALSYGSMNDPILYALCQESLANAGNYYTLYQKIMEDAQLCPLLIRSYAVYAQRGAFEGLKPARDNVFYYTTGKTMEQALLPE